jgi:DNA-binding NarL/FixJ family response regulator
MKLNLLIAESRDILRTGLRTIFIADERVEHVYEATTSEDLQTHLRTGSSDLIIANQSLVTDITALPPGRFVILASEFDMMTFQAAYKHGAKGYLLENSSVELLRTILYLADGAFLIEPAITAQVIDNLSYDSRFLIKEELLTPREKEIIGLLREGVDRRTIARQLHISEATLKTHIKNIAKKRENTFL